MTIAREIRIAGFGGSLRHGSYNNMLLKLCSMRMPEGSTLEICDISRIPVYNPDNEENPGEAVKDFRKSLESSNGILIVTPEYNYSIPGFIKNAIDSVSRPMDKNPFKGKPVAIMSASTGMLGGSRAQYHLRQVLQFLEASTIQKPEIFISFAGQKFTDNGELKDEVAMKFIDELLTKLVTIAADEISRDI